MSGEESLSDRKLYQYDLNKDDKVDSEDLILMFELYATNTEEIKNDTNGMQLRKQIKKLFKTNKFSDKEKEHVGEQITNIYEQHIYAIEIRNTDNMVKTEKGKQEIT